MLGFYKNASVRSSDLILSVIFLLLAAVILMAAYFSPDGYVTRDGSNYLRLAQNLIERNGYFSPVYDATGQAGSDDVFFAIWPIGYPTSIFLIAKLTGLSVFWSSKVLNILFVAFLLEMFRRFLPKPHHFALVLLFAGNMQLFLATLSELMFLVLIVGFSFSVHAIASQSTKSVLPYLCLLLTALLLFLTKYVGALAIGIIGLLGIYCLLHTRQYAKAFTLFGIAALSAVLMGAYLYYNYLNAGHITGIVRIKAPETIIELTSMFVSALIAETVVFISHAGKTTLVIAFIQLVIFSVACLRYRDHLKLAPISESHKLLLISLTLVSLVYLICILMLRSISHFDNISYRFLAPTTFLLSIVGVLFFQYIASSKARKIVGSFFVCGCVLSYLVNGPVSIINHIRQSGNYNATISELEKMYESVEEGSTVIFGSIHVNYMYTGILNRTPYRYPYGSFKETWTDFLSRLNYERSGKFYIQGPQFSLSEAQYDLSIVNAVNSYPKGRLSKLKPLQDAVY